MASEEDVMNRIQAMEQEVLRVRQMAAQAEQRAIAAEQRANVSDQVLTQLSQLPTVVAQAVAMGARSHTATRQLIDPRGLGKPPSFKGTESEFQM